MRLKTAILGGAAALMLSTGLAGAALADTPKPTAPRVSTVGTPEPSVRVCRSHVAKPSLPSQCLPVPVPRPALPTYTG
ncbi:MAG: hypothetical protein JWP34_5159 [Massilia sp.]|jgi:hypothetical protein|nr:hypothetical protein [Massilia sp.]